MKMIMQMIKPIDKTFILYAWHLLGAICLEKWISDPLIQVMREIDAQTNELGDPTDQAIE